MSDSIQDILKQLDAGYAPSRQLIQQQIDAIPAQEQAQQQGLEATQAGAFQDITNGARDRGVGFSGIPIGEQAKYTAGTFLPAVANLKASSNQQKTSLLGALAGQAQDQQKTAFGIQQQQQAQDFQQQQADRAAKAAVASSSSLASLFGGGSPTDTTPPVADPYATVDKTNANTAIKSLLGTGNASLIAKTVAAIQASAAHGNLYDKYKLDLLGSLGTNSQYGPLISKASQAGMKVPSF